jgi:hypothetical protein
VAKANVLKLLAEDAEGLGVIAAAVQDALVKLADIKFSARARTFAVEVNRFQWEQAGQKAPWFRSRAVLAFAGVEKAQAQGVPKGTDEVLSLLSIEFRPGETPGGEVRLSFANNATMRLGVECLDVTLMDVGPAWPTKRKPDHRVGT